MKYFLTVGMLLFTLLARAQQPDTNRIDMIALGGIFLPQNSGHAELAYYHAFSDKLMGQVYGSVGTAYYGKTILEKYSMGLKLHYFLTSNAHAKLRPFVAGGIQPSALNKEYSRLQSINGVTVASIVEKGVEVAPFAGVGLAYFPCRSLYLEAYADALAGVRSTTKTYFDHNEDIISEYSQGYLYTYFLPGIRIGLSF